MAYAQSVGIEWMLKQRRLTMKTVAVLEKEMTA
jgi:hypothetical protein